MRTGAEGYNTLIYILHKNKEKINLSQQISLKFFVKPLQTVQNAPNYVFYCISIPPECDRFVTIL